MSFLVYTPPGDFVVAKKVYRSYLLLVLYKVIPWDLIELEMIDFDVIIGIEYLHACYASIVCRT